jgi:tetratricopeptide (TPR) repeat protein
MDEERSVGSRLLAVLAYDPVSTLVLLFDRHEGLLLRTWAEQARRSALFSGLSLVVVDSTVDPPSALDHDTRLDTIDACLLGPDGQEPPPALRAHLAQEAVTTLPEMPFPYCVLGQTLHAQIAAREHNDELLGEFNRWYRDVRCRFPLAEWPQQIYAQVLELYGRASEAGIAWTDALDIDVDDPRNAHGRARAAFELNLLDLAEATLSLGMVHAPNDVKMNQFRAVVALERNDLRMADLCARMACTLSGDDASSLLTRATVEERNGKDSKALLQSAVDKDPNSYTSHLRLYRANVSSGDWKEAEERITAMAALWPGNPDTVLLQSRILSIQGRGIDGMDRAIEGLQRFGSRPELVESVADLCTASFTDEELFVRIAGLAEQFATMPGFSSRFGYGLMVSGYPMAAVGVLGRALQSDPGEANIRWWLCQALCGFESQRSQGNADLRSLLVEFFEVYHSRYLPMVLLLAEQELSHDPERALHWLSDESVDINLAPALAWDLLDRILRALDRPDDAEGLRERISSLGPAGIVEHASFLRSSGRNAIASRLLSTALKENPGHAGVQEELAWCLLQEDHVVEAHAIASAMESPTYTLAVEVGSLSNDWEMVEKATDEIEAQYDGWTTLDRAIWPNRATAALAALGKGHDMPMASLLEKAGQDGRTLDLVRRRGRRLRHSLLDEINDRLQRVAPGRLGAEEWK